MDNEQSPFVDPAKNVLSGAPGINDDDKAELWDIFHESKDHNELAQRLQPVAIPDSLKAQLYDAKKKNAPVAEPLDKATEAIKRVAEIDPKVLEMAEKYPNVLKALTSAAGSASKEAGKASEPGKPAGKGKEADEAEKEPAMDPDVPATPPGHALVRTRDGALHHLPVENVDKAKAIDPELTVLHVEP